MDWQQAQRCVAVAGLEDGERVALLACKLDVVSNEAMAAAAGGAERADGYVASKMLGLLADVHDAYRGDRLADGLPRDVALELLWVATPVSNRPYDAEVALYLIIRAIGDAPDEAAGAVCRLMSLCATTLDQCAYSYAFVGLDDLARVVGGFSDEAIVALRKAERLDDLQVGGVSYAFDRLPDDPGAYEDIDRLTGLLHDCPGCAVSCQVIPAGYTPTEREALNALAT